MEREYESFETVVNWISLQATDPSPFTGVELVNDNSLI